MKPNKRSKTKKLSRCRGLKRTEQQTRPDQWIADLAHAKGYTFHDLQRQAQANDISVLDQLYINEHVAVNCGPQWRELRELDTTRTKENVANLRCIKQQTGWFVLLLDDEYNAQHLRGKLVLKTPIECWSYDPSGEEPPVPYGQGNKYTWTVLNEHVCGGKEQPLVPLAFDAILVPNGHVIVPGLASLFSSVQQWAQWAKGTVSPDAAKILVVDCPGTKARSGAYGPGRPGPDVPF